MKKQVVVIHGGDTFETYETFLAQLSQEQIDIERFSTDQKNWKANLRGGLSDDFEVILPMMPNKDNAHYAEWKMWFEKFIPFLRDGVALVGHSLGASFLAKYLSENKFPRKIAGVFLVAGCFDKDSIGNSLADFSLPKKLELQTENIFLYHSKDDPVVPFSDVEEFNKAFPNATLRVFENRGHIRQENFPELVADIKNLKV